MNIERHFTGKNIALVAVFAALIAVCTWLPSYTLGTGVSITLQTFAVVLAALVLGPWRGATAVLLYITVGTLGAPIFSKGVGGVSVWSGPTAGYLVGFVFAAIAVGYLAVWLKRKNSSLDVPSLIGAGLASLPVIYLFGVPWLAYKLSVPIFNAAEEGGGTGLAWGLTPFLFGDLVKVALAAAVAVAIHRAFPQLLNDSQPVAADKKVSAKQVAATK